MKALAITTGPCELVRWDVEVAAEVRRKDKPWWKGDVPARRHQVDRLRLRSQRDVVRLRIRRDRHQPRDLGRCRVADRSAWGSSNSEIATGSTIVARFNVGNTPYDDVKVRRAAQLAVDNAAVLKLGLDGRGSLAENHHVGPMHPEYADIGPAKPRCRRRPRSCSPRPARPITSTS